MRHKPLIMLTNDDGWDSVGLMASWIGLRRLADPLVVVPERPMSGVGKAVTMRRRLAVTTFKCEGLGGYAVDGTPADCVLIGMNKIATSRPNLLVSGVNLGPNLGLDDFFSSGTIGACIQGAIQGIPSISVSYCVDPHGKKIELEELSLASEVVYLASRHVLRWGMPQGVDAIVINVPKEALKPKITETKLARSPYPDIHVEIGEGIYEPIGWSNDLYRSGDVSDDVRAIMAGRVSVVAISLRSFMDREDYPVLSDLVSELNEGLSGGDESP